MSIYQLKPDGEKKCKIFSEELNCCIPLPHYSSPISDADFVLRNIALTNTSGEEYSPLNNLITSYPGGGAALAEEERNTMPKCKRAEYDRQEAQARRWNYNKYYYQDLNQGRFYARGLSDDLDLTLSEANNTTSGWYNGLYGIAPGQAPYRDPRCSDIGPPFNPMCNRTPLAPMNSLGSRSYRFDTIYDHQRYPSRFCMSGQNFKPPNPNPRCSDDRCFLPYPENNN